MPILRGIEIEKAFFLVDCFQESNLGVLEVSLNQPNSYDLLEALTKRFGSDMSIGAGTVLTKKMAYDARNLGASFFLGPNTSEEVFDAAKETGIPYIPGALTPTEIQYASELGADLIKVFPVRQLGASYIKDVLASLNTADLLAVGGVDVSNIKELLNAGVKGVGVGSSLVEKEWLHNKERAKIIKHLEGLKQSVQ